MSDQKPDVYEYIMEAFGPAGGGDKPYRSAEFNAAAAHVLVLLEDACAAFRRRSFGTATFLAITALEETAKAELFGFRKSAKVGEKAPPDPLRSHRKKHWFAVRETVFMGKRLLAAVGSARCAAIKAEAAAGGLVALREAALYSTMWGTSWSPRRRPFLRR